MREPIWVSPDAVLAIHQMLIAERCRALGIRGPKFLGSALARPRHKLSYDDGASIFLLAACYSFGVGNSRAFVDGNKRIVPTAAAVFLELNGYTLDDPTTGEAVAIYEELASGSLSEERSQSGLRTPPLRLPSQTSKAQAYLLANLDNCQQPNACARARLTT